MARDHADFHDYKMGKAPTHRFPASTKEFDFTLIIQTYQRLKSSEPNRKTTMSSTQVASQGESWRGLMGIAPHQLERYVLPIAYTQCRLIIGQLDVETVTIHRGARRDCIHDSHRPVVASFSATH
jgi:hypothetical protein